MRRNKKLVVMMTTAQYEQVKMEAQLKGFVTVSQYTRDLLLKRTFDTDKKIAALYNKLIVEPLKPRSK